MGRPRLLLADDHAMIAEALQHLLQEEFDVVGVVSDGRALVKAAAQLKPDVAVIDIGMPLLNGLDAAQLLKERQPEIKVVFITQNCDPDYAIEAFRRNASGYLLKSSGASELTTAIRQALLGECYISPLIAARILKDVLGSNQRKMQSRELSTREREVLQLLAEGKAMKAAARLLQISEKTVQYHKYRIMKALGIETNAQLVQYALNRGLIIRERAF